MTADAFVKQYRHFRWPSDWTPRWRRTFLLLLPVSWPLWAALVVLGLFGLLVCIGSAWAGDFWRGRSWTR